MRTEHRKKLTAPFLIFLVMFFLLMLKANAAVAWEIMTVDSASLGGNIHLVNHPVTDNPSIAYFDQSTYEVRYATLGNGQWDMSVVKSFQDYSISDWTTCLDFHPQTGYPAVTYFDDNWNLFYAATAGGSQWYEEPVDYNIMSGVATSFAFDHNGTPWIAYQVLDYSVPKVQVKVAKKAGISWNVTVFEEDAAAVDLAINPSTGYPALAYFKASSYVPPQGKIMYAYFDGSTWVKEIVDNQLYIGGRGMPSLAFTPASGSSYPAIAFTAQVKEDDLDLKYAHWNGSSWTIETVDDTSDVNQWAELAFNPVNGKPAIAYGIVSGPYYHRSLLYASFDGNSWIREVVDDSGSERSLAFAVNGSPGIAYQGTGSLLLYAYKPGGPHDYKGDIDDDGNLDLTDAILGLQIIAGLNPQGISLQADVNGDNKIGIEEAIYVLQRVAGLR